MHASEHHPKDFIGTGKYNNLHGLFSTKICHADFYTRPKYLTARWEGKKMDTGEKIQLGNVPNTPILEAKALFNRCRMIVNRMT